jgi:enoyl-CoA hydratase/carnithine racemase
MVLQYEVADHVATVTLNRPEVKNALNRELYGQLEQAFRDAHRDPEVRAVIITGAGNAFCSGDDVKQIMLAEQPDTPATRAREPKPRPTKAAELLFTGDIIDAEEAERISLVSRVVPHHELMAKARELAAKIAANPPIAMRYLKQGLRMSAPGDPREIGAYVMNSLAYLFTTEDHREGALSFIEKREPQFKGR